MENITSILPIDVPANVELMWDKPRAKVILFKNSEPKAFKNLEDDFKNHEDDAIRAAVLIIRGGGNKL